MISGKTYLSEDWIQKLYQVARQARETSYSPYSGFKVGAALLTTDEQIFSGCNVENSSYGATVCAERVALFSAVSRGYRQIKAVMVVTDANEPWPPCGMCRQVLYEFASPEIPVILSNLKGKMIKKSMGELCPQFFGPSHLS